MARKNTHKRKNGRLFLAAALLTLATLSGSLPLMAEEETETQELETEGLETEGLETEGLETKEPEAEGPEAEGLETEGLETEGPETEGLETEESGTEGTEAGEPETEESGTEEPGTEGTETGEAETEEPGTEGTETQEAQTEEPGTEEPETGEPKTGVPSDINGHAYVTESSGYRLYMKEEDLSVIIEDKKTGSIMESYPSYDDTMANNTWWGAMNSAVVITIINNNDDTKQADLLYNEVQKEITYTDDGFSAVLYWTQYDFGVTLEASLTDDGFVCRIPELSIIENSDQYYIGTICMYPYMGISWMADKEGYMLVPDGNGALIYLNDKEGRFKSGYSGKIYGTDTGFDDSDVSTLLWDRYDMISDSEMTFAPIFGIAHTDDQMAYLGIVEEGQERASIEVVPNGVAVNYNRSFPKFVLRRLYTQPTSNNSTAGSLHIYEADRSHSGLQVRYIFLSGEDATYSGMANAYRGYLLESGQLVPQEDVYRTRVDFLGTERENWVLGTSAVTMTTVDDIRAIYEDLEKEGVDGLLSVYKGWQDGGLYNVPIGSYSPDGKIGSAKKLAALIRDAKEKGTLLYLYDDALRINPDETNATFNIVKKVNKRRFEEKTFGEVYDIMLFLTPARSQYLLDKFAKSAVRKGADQICLAGITSHLFTYTYSGSKFTRFDTAKAYATAAEKLDASARVVMEQPFAYLWKNTEAFLDMPLYTSSYILEDESIPFLSMVLRGSIPVYAEYVNFEANKQEFLLKMIESGAFPSFYITQAEASELMNTNSSSVYSSQYGVYKETICEYDRILREFHEKTAGATIDGHTILDGGVTRVTYSNGTVVYLNYSQEEQTADGVTIAPMSYEVTGYE